MSLWQGATPTEGTDAPTWTVAELGEALSMALTDRFPTRVWVQGEIRNLKNPNPKGHRYFDLVEAPPEPGARPTATLSIALFNEARMRVNAKLREAGGAARMSDGVQIRIRARVNWWVGTGQLRLIMDDIDPVFTIGVLEAERAKLLAKLAQEGLLDMNSRRRLPALPLRVALVTSYGSAAHADALHELESSGYRFQVTTIDARVQGRDAPASVARALAAAADYDVDVVLLVRGGGARTDLVAFDSEQVARAIATCSLPVFCGVGHEVDRSVADEVAHTSAKTPTACAAELVSLVQATDQGLQRSMANLARHAQATLLRASSRMDRAALRTHNASERRLRDARAGQSALIRRLITAPSRQLSLAGSRLDHAQQTVTLADPARLLARGWSITRTLDGTAVRDPADAPPGTVVVTTVAGGSIKSRVESPGADKTHQHAELT